jgi:hypothetical protein
MLSRFFVPDTVNYMIAGYTMLAVVITAYLVSIYLRWKKTKKEYQSLKERE